ncbi:MAG: UvrD-helicase domain-containing protein [Coriobacteriia bacterium]
MMKPFEPTEEQAAAIRSLEGPVCIAAGAGSGKTRVLAERFARAVRGDGLANGPAPIDGQLAVTFTDKAAGELAERVRRVLLQAGMRDESRRMDEAWISTIHGLCSRLLRREALEAGVDPRFGVASNVEAGEIAEEAFDAAARAALSAGDVGVIALVEAYGLPGARKMTFDLVARTRAMGEPLSAVGSRRSEPVARLVGDAEHLLAETASHLAACGCGNKTAHKNVAGCEAAIEAIDAVPRIDVGAGETVRGLRRALLDFAGDKGAGAHKEVIAEYRERRDTLLSKTAAVLLDGHVAALLRLAESFSLSYTDLKAVAGVLDFDDLQERTLALLESTEDVAARYRERFRLVMVDEYQDTSGVQDRIADALGGGHLCVVGDERQAIYGWRYADPEVFGGRRRAVETAGGPVLRVSSNFRSHPGVLAFVNEVFGADALFGEGFVPLRAARSSDEERDWPAGTPRVRLTVVTGGGDARERYRREAGAVAGRFASLVADGIDPSGMVILLRALTHAGAYADALRERGIECIVAARGSLLERPETRALLATLRLAVNLGDEEAAAALLASPFAGLSDDALWLAREADSGSLLGGALVAELPEADAAGARRAAEAVRVARAAAGRRGVAAALNEACEALDMDLALLADGDEGRRAYANVLKLSRLADEHERAGGSGIASFLEHVRLKKRFDDEEPAATVVGAPAGAVRIMSVHGAKGLEFPVVAIPDLGRSISHDPSRMLLDVRPGEGPVLSLRLPSDEGGDPGQRSSPAYADAAERASLARLEEEKRVLYVACTRAEEGLLLFASMDPAKPTKDDVPADWLRAALGLTDPSAYSGDKLRVEVVEGPGPREGRRAPARDDAGVDDGASRGVAFAESLETPAEAFADTDKVSYSDLHLFERCSMRFFAERVLRLGVAPTGEGEGPRRFGDAVHAALRIAGADRAVGEDRLDVIGRYWRLDSEGRRRLGKAAGAFSRSSIAGRARETGRVTCEASFDVPLADVRLAGSIDLLAEEGTSFLAVDYKTGAGAADPTTAYRLQADCYALALLRSGAEEVEVVFVEVENIVDGAPVHETFAYTTRDTETLAGAFAERVERMRARDFRPLAAWTPDPCEACAAQGVSCSLTPARRRRGAG